MLRMFERKKEQCCLVYTTATDNPARQIELLTKGKFNHLFSTSAVEPNAFFAAQFKVFASLQEAQKSLYHRSKELQRIYILEMKNNQRETESLAAKGQFSEGIKSVIDGVSCLETVLQKKTAIKDIGRAKS